MTYTFLSAATPGQIDQIIRLYRAEGWWSKPQDDPELIRRIVEGSHLFLVAEEEGSVVAMGRAISDRASDAYIQDVTVRDTHRKRGIGSEIVRRLTASLKADGMEWIGLIAEKGSRTFYEKLEFTPMGDAVPMLKKAPWNSSY